MKNEENSEAYLHNLVVINRSDQEDVVDGIYQIDLNVEIVELSNEFCKYYNAVAQEGQEYFAIVFGNHFVPDFNAINILKNSNIENLNKLIAYSVVRISNSGFYQLVLIVEKYNFKNNLFNHINRFGALPADQVKNVFIADFNVLISELEKRNIACGNINPSNIILLDDGKFLLREPIISYPHFDQTGCYLAPELVECTESGRYIPSVAADIYALGVVVFYMLTGKQPWLDYKNIYLFNEERFEHTSFKLLIGKQKISENFRIFFKWVLHDNSSFRWHFKNISEWLLDDFPKSASFEKISENNNFIAFNGRNYSSLKSISHAFFHNWKDALQFIQDDRLLKWVQRHSFNNNITEELQELLINFDKDSKVLYGNERSKKLTKILSIIDRQGGIRSEGLGLSVNAIPKALHYLYIKGKHFLIEQIIRVIKECCWRTSGDKTSASSIETHLDQEFKSISKFFTLSSPMFGLERVIYSLNPYAICLSPMLVDEHISSLAELLQILEDIAKQTPEKFVIDRHIIAFISAKISLKQESDIKILSNFPKLSDHYLIFALSILNIAQQHEPDIKIPNLCNVMALEIIELLNDNLYNVNYKQKLSESLKAEAASGELSKIVAKLTNQTEFMDDYNGYYKACREAENLKNQINILKSEDKIFENAIFLGQKVTVLVSYVLCFIVTVSLVV